LAALALAGCDGTRVDALELRLEAPPPQHTTTELIHYGVDTPRGTGDLKWLVASRDLVDSGPFDGLVLDVGLPDTGSVSADAFGDAVAVLQGAHFQRLVTNFQVLKLDGGDPFDDAAWIATIQRAGQVALVARRAGLRGIFLDTQSANGWSYAAQVPSRGTFEQYEARAKQRGYDFMNAITAAYPDIDILLSLAFAAVFVDACFGGAPLATEEYGLLPSFLDGMMTATSDLRVAARLTDAFLPSYPTRDPDAFRLYYDLMHFDWTAAQAHWLPNVVTYRYAFDAPSQDAGERVWPATATSTCDGATSARLQRNLTAAFGLMINFEDWKRPPLDPAGAANDYRPPDVLEHVVRLALATADAYVWIWSTQPYWPLPSRSEPPLPQVYKDALTRARAASPP
jgi:hypothetical protein